MNDERIRLILDLGNSGKNVQEVREELEKLDGATKRAGEAADKATKSTGDFGRSAMETGRIVQDFAQGGLGGIINNLEGFTRAIGLGPGAAGVITLLGVAALTAAPAIKALWKEIVDGSNEVPRSTDALTRMNDALETNKARLKELADQGKLTNTELAEFNRLAAESTRLEKEANAEKDRRNELEKARREEQAGDQESAEIAKAAIGEFGGVDKAIDAAGQSLFDRSRKTGRARQLFDESAELERRRMEAERAGQDTLVVPGPGGQVYNVDREQYFAGQQARNRRAQQADAADIRTQASDLVVRARQGDRAAIDQLRDLIPGAALDQANPAAIRAQNQEVEDVGAEGDRLHRAGQARREAAKAAAEAGRRSGKLVDDLNAEGRSNEAAMGRGEQADAAAQRARAIANARAAGKGPVADDRGKEIGRIQQEMARNNTTTQKLMERGFDVTGQTQQQIAEVQAINAQLANRLRLLEQGSRKIQTRMGRVR